MKDGHGVSGHCILVELGSEYRCGDTISEEYRLYHGGSLSVGAGRACAADGAATASGRTISVRPDVGALVDRKEYYRRDVWVGSSGSRPYVGVQKETTLRFGQDERAILLPSAFFVEDFEPSAGSVTLVMRNLTPAAELHKSDGAGTYSKMDRDSDGLLEFALEELQRGLIAIYYPGPSGRRVVFGLAARDPEGNVNDLGKSNTYEPEARSFTLDAVLALSPQEVEVDPQTGYQRAGPFGGLETVIESVRAGSSRDGTVRLVLKHAVSGDRLEMHEHVDDVVGSWIDGGHGYALTVSDRLTPSAKEAIAHIYKRVCGRADARACPELG